MYEIDSNRTDKRIEYYSWRKNYTCAAYFIDARRNLTEVLVVLYIPIILMSEYFYHDYNCLAV